MTCDLESALSTGCLNFPGNKWDWEILLWKYKYGACFDEFCGLIRLTLFLVSEAFCFGIERIPPRTAVPIWCCTSRSRAARDL